jgi:hypothetical protein
MGASFKQIFLPLVGAVAHTTKLIWKQSKMFHVAPSGTITI